MIKVKDDNKNIYTISEALIATGKDKTVCNELQHTIDFAKQTYHNYDGFLVSYIASKIEKELHYEIVELIDNEMNEAPEGMIY